jgi:tripartite-type tricarboxylate transporter receptor subunit TctC
VKVLGIASTAPSAMFPEWPTIAAALPGYETRTWIAAFAPAGTPPDITAKLGADIRRALADSAVRERFQALNLEVVGSSGEELARVMKSDTEKWGRLIRERNIKVGQ